MAGRAGYNEPAAAGAEITPDVAHGSEVNRIMLALDVDAEAWAGIVAFYSIIHIPRGQMTAALQELKRVLRPQGLLLLSFHVGIEDVIERPPYENVEYPSRRAYIFARKP
jgi:SAM-dependent methyltransferase